MQNDPRLALIEGWLSRDLGLSWRSLEPASSDASFRRYFRVTGSGGERHIVMDAPPEHEDVRPYLEVGALLQSIGVHVPRVHAAAPERGLVLLEDLGSTHMLAALNAGGDADALYGAALDALAIIQSRGGEAARELPPYDQAALLRELELMPQWFLARHLGIEPDRAERELLDQVFARLIGDALEQPQVFVHRDYHSRNLMVLPVRGPGVIDFQDALRGPVGYDIVSLLKDCYVAWPRERLRGWLAAYRARLLRAGGGGAGGVSEAQLLRWVDFIGLQRHIKVLGIFARLWHRDGKPGYLGDLPLVLKYVGEAARLYPEFAKFAAWLERRIVPAFAAANARALQAAVTAGRG